MIAVDTNLLVYAHRVDSEWHEPALAAVRGLAEGKHSWGIPWPCVHEFLAIVTHPRIYAPPSPVALALDAVEEWLKSPTCRVLGEGPGYFTRLRRSVLDAKAIGPRVHDARIAAICLENGVAELWTADRDFSRFPALVARNPLV